MSHMQDDDSTSLDGEDDPIVPIEEVTHFIDEDCILRSKRTSARKAFERIRPAVEPREPMLSLID